jgi:hypothetical protein
MLGLLALAVTLEMWVVELGCLDNNNYMIHVKPMVVLLYNLSSSGSGRGSGDEAVVGKVEHFVGVVKQWLLLFDAVVGTKYPDPDGANFTSD